MAEVAESGRKAIIFSQWVQPLERIAAALTPYRPLLFHGKVPHRERQHILDLFKKDESRHVLLMSYGTGSVGLNLQFTNYVFLFDRWWNPAVEDQAINRAHRLGQKETVFVTRFRQPGNHRGPHRGGLGEKAATVPRHDRAKRPTAVAGIERGRNFWALRRQGAAQARGRVNGHRKFAKNSTKSRNSVRDIFCIKIRRHRGRPAAAFLDVFLGHAERLDLRR